MITPFKISSGMVVGGKYDAHGNVIEPGIHYTEQEWERKLMLEKLERIEAKLDQLLDK